MSSDITKPTLMQHLIALKWKMLEHTPWSAGHVVLEPNTPENDQLNREIRSFFPGAVFHYPTKAD